LLRWTASVGPVTTSGVFVCRGITLHFAHSWKSAMR
jgi:hypothetical protein